MASQLVQIPVFNLPVEIICHIFDFIVLALGLEGSLQIRAVSSKA